MNRKKINLLIGSIIAVSATLSFDGCSKPKIVEYKPYSSNTYLYREIVDKNKIGWRESLIDDVKEYDSYVKSTFNKIDSNQKYLQRMYNDNTIKKKKAKQKKHDDDISYGDVIFDDEYSF